MTRIEDERNRGDKRDGGAVDVGSTLAPRTLRSIGGNLVPVPGDGPVHLQFRRYAGCPVCNLHLRSFTARHGELVRAGVREVVVFHSTAETMREFQGDLPFDAVADPDKILYAEFGVGTIGLTTAWRGMTPRSWRAATTALREAPSLRGAVGRGEKHLGLPADFLIAPDGRVVAAHHGIYLDDHWSVDDVLALAAA